MYNFWLIFSRQTNFSVTNSSAFKNRNPASCSLLNVHNSKFVVTRDWKNRTVTIYRTTSNKRTPSNSSTPRIDAPPLDVFEIINALPRIIAPVRLFELFNCKKSKILKHVLQIRHTRHKNLKIVQ